MSWLPFDTVVIREAGKPERSLTPEAFLDLPLHERVRVMLRKELHFMRDGVAVDKGYALTSLATRRKTEPSP